MTAPRKRSFFLAVDIGITPSDCDFTFIIMDRISPVNGAQQGPAAFLRGEDVI